MCSKTEGVQSGFSLDLLDIELGGEKCRGDKLLMGKTHEGGIDIMRGPNFDRLYHKLKVLLLLLLLLLCY